MSHIEPNNDLDQLFQDLDTGATLITVNNRLARALLEHHEQRQIAAGRTVWQTPDILPLGAWLRRQYQHLLEQGHTPLRLLTPPQEQLLWEQVIRQQQPELLQPGAAARAAASAHGLMQQWRLPMQRIIQWGSPETRAFAHWQQAFEQHCAKLVVLSPARLPGLLCEHPEDGADLWLAGFDELAPDLRQLFATLAERGRRVFRLETPAPRGIPRHLTANDAEEERRLIARWALARLRANPAARIAIVCPDIAGQREPLRQVLQQTLDPAALQPGQATARAPFNFSLGLPLAAQPLSGDALLSLELVLHGLELPLLGRLLRSPQLGADAAEADARALLDVALRRRGHPHYRLTDLLHIINHTAEDAAHHCPDLQQRLQALEEQRRAAPRQRLASDWGETFLQWLELLGWPGYRSLDSREFQEAEALRGLLRQLADLDPVQGQISAAEALRQLQQLADDNLFQAEGSDAPIQVLGVLEAAGLSFDHLWLMGLDEVHWPPPPAPNPLLPTALQRELDMPHASPERELQYAHQVTGRLLASADEVIISHPSRTADGAQRASPLLGHIANLQTLTADELDLDNEVDIPTSVPLQRLTDWQAPPLADRQPGGGTTLLADQAACPFRALARHRLRAEPLEEATFGPDAGMVGSLVHRALELVWRQLKTQQALCDSTTAARDALVKEAAGQAIDELARQRPDLYHGRFRALEQTRLSDLLRDWLTREAARPGFRVAELEQRQQVAVGPLRLQVRADRVDELADGRLLVIDYKTGQGDPSRRWLDERPGEPQVPLYSVQQRERVAGAAIARVRSDDKAGFVGLSAESLAIDGIETFAGNDTLGDWQALLEHWQQGLSTLAQEIADGRADPTPSTASCQYCTLPALCRVDFHPAEDAADE